MDDKSLAMELIEDSRKNSKRWFVISIVLLIILFASNICWLIYESQFNAGYEEQIQAVENTDLESSSISQY